MSNVGGWSRGVSHSVTVGLAARSSIVVVAVCAGTVGGVGLMHKKQRLFLGAVGEVAVGEVAIGEVSVGANWQSGTGDNMIGLA